MSESDADTLAHFPAHAADTLRYGDTDRQGHVNNAVYATFFETGRVELLGEALGPGEAWTGEFVLAQITIDYLREVHWPGTVTIGSRVQRLGTTSLTVDQELASGGEVCARARSVMVQIDAHTRRPLPLDEGARGAFARFTAAGE